MKKVYIWLGVGLFLMVYNFRGFLVYGSWWALVAALVWPFVCILIANKHRVAYIKQQQEAEQRMKTLQALERAAEKLTGERND